MKYLAPLNGGPWPFLNLLVGSGQESATPRDIRLEVDELALEVHLMLI